MLSFRRAVQVCAGCLSLLALSAAVPVLAQTAFQLNYKVLRGSLIVVPVHVNNSEVVDFMLDTGTSRTIVDCQLMRANGLVPIGKTTLSGLQGTAASSIVEVESLSMGGATVHGLKVCVRGELPYRIRGVLGEDFLHNFDLLIDYHRHVIEFEPVKAVEDGADDRLLVARVSGERLPIGLEGSFNGGPTQNRLTVRGYAKELGEKPLTLQLDSGSDSLMLFNQSVQFGAEWERKTSSATGMFQVATSMSMNQMRVQMLTLGSSITQNVDVIVPSHHIDADVDGVLPTSLFRSIFICHSGRFVILNPSQIQAH